MAPKGNNSNNIPSLIPLKIVPGQNLTTSSFEPQKPQKNLKQQKQQKMILPKNEGKHKILTKKLTDVDNRPLNKTFTIAKSSNNINKEDDKFNRKRSNSFDSDFVDFGKGGTLRIRVEKTCFAMDWGSKELRGRKSGNNNLNNNFQQQNKERRELNKNKDSTPKLPSLEGFLPGRTCCQLQFCRFSNLELLKYKRNLMN
ncbi:hypothetical protein ACQ4LE_009462 [Meloidogyne hapla]|uniref:Uncharacterized protein n=1 Tax=Meloidogyne hapla TaxID=6305 RepID=A0A1I8C018_MELHA